MQSRHTSTLVHKIYLTISTIKRAKQLKKAHIENEQTNEEPNKDDIFIFESRTK